MYGKSLQQDGTGAYLSCSRSGASKNQSNGGSNTTNGCQDEAQDPSVHPWGGLITTRDGTLTLLDCYLYSKSLKGLQNVSGQLTVWHSFHSSFMILLYLGAHHLLESGLWQCTCKGKGAGIAISWCLWWWRTGLDKPRNSNLWQRTWDKGNMCPAHSKTFLWYIGGFLVSIRRGDSTISFKNEGRGFHWEAHVQVCLAISSPLTCSI